MRTKHRDYDYYDSHRSSSPTTEIVQDDSTRREPLGRRRGDTKRSETTDLIKQQPLPTTREEATWQILSIFNNNVKLRTEPALHLHLLKVLRLYPCLAKEPFYHRSSIFNKKKKEPTSWLPLTHLIAVDASLDILQKVLQLYPMAIQQTTAGNDKQQSQPTFPLHIACRFASDETIHFLADAYPEALLMESHDLGYPLHCLLHRNEVLAHKGQKSSNGPLLNKLKFVLDLCPDVLSTSKSVDKILELAIQKELDLECLEYIVGQIPSGVDELNLVEQEGGKPWYFGYYQVQMIANNLFPRLTKLTCNVKHWGKDGLLVFLQSLPLAENLKHLQLALPDDVHLKHFHGEEILKALQEAFTRLPLLVEIQLSLFNRLQGIMEEEDHKWDHDQILVATTNALVVADDHQHSQLQHLVLQNFRLSSSETLSTLFTNGAAPRKLDLVDVSLEEGTWKSVPQAWGACRVQNLSIFGRQPQTKWLHLFLMELRKAVHLKSLSLGFTPPMGTPAKQMSEPSVLDPPEDKPSHPDDHKPDLTMIPLMKLLEDSTLEKLRVKGAIAGLDDVVL